MEFKRIFANKKVLITIITLLAISVVFYIYGIYETANYNGINLSDTKVLKKEVLSTGVEDVYSEFEKFDVMISLLQIDNIKSEDFSEYEEFHQNEEALLLNQYPEYAEEYKKHKNDKNFITTRFSTYYYFVSQMEYVDSFYSNIEGIKEKANQLKTISIFSENTSDKNIDKTVYDYEKIQNQNLTLGIDEPIMELVNFSFARYVVVIFAFFVISSFFEERKKGLYPLVYGTNNGRMVLAIKRLGILFSTVIIFSIILNLILIIVGCGIFGNIELDRSIQSIQMFENFTIPMNIGGFLIFYILNSCVLALLISVIIWLVFSIIKIPSISLLAIFGFFGLEYILYTKIELQSRLVFLKSVNIFSFFNINEFITEYRNIGFLNMTLNRIPLTIFSSLILILIISVLCLIINAKSKAVKSHGFLMRSIESILNLLSSTYHNIISKLPFSILELYKILILQKGIIFIFIAIFMSLKSYNIQNYVYSSEELFMNKFYEDYGGKADDNVYTYLDETSIKLNDVSLEYENATSKYHNNQITQDELEKATRKYEAYDVQRAGYENICEKLEAIEKSSYKVENDMYLINQRGYNYLLGEEGKEARGLSALIQITIIILMFSGTFSFENKSGTVYLLKSTSKGRGSLSSRKILVNLILILIIFTIFSGIEIFTYSSNFGLDFLNAPIQNLNLCSNFTGNYSILVYIITSYISRLIVYILISLGVSLFSIWGKYEKACIILSIILLLPSALYLIGFNMFYSLSIVKVLDMLMTKSFGLLIIISFILSIACITIYYIIQKSWKQLKRS